MRILFLHGLESQPDCKKVKWLRGIGHTIVSPDIGYENINAYEKIAKDYKHSNFDIIIGSSMGGWFAYNLGKDLNVPVLLLNPALHSRHGIVHTISEWVGEETKGSKIFLALGKEDVVINPTKTLEWLEEHDKLDWNPNNCKIGNYGHRTALPYFKDIWMHFEESIHETLSYEV